MRRLLFLSKRVGVIDSDRTGQSEIVDNVGVSRNIVDAVSERGGVAAVKGVVEMQINSLVAARIQEQPPAQIHHRVVTVSKSAAV